VYCAFPLALLNNLVPNWYTAIERCMQPLANYETYVNVDRFCTITIPYMLKQHLVIGG